VIDVRESTGPVGVPEPAAEGTPGLLRSAAGDPLLGPASMEGNLPGRQGAQLVRRGVWGDAPNVVLDT
jgi:hypothetical protein